MTDNLRAGGMDQWLRALNANPENSGSIPRTCHIVTHSCLLTTISGDPSPLLASVGTRHACGALTYIQANIYIKNKNKFKIS